MTLQFYSRELNTGVQTNKQTKTVHKCLQKQYLQYPKGRDKANVRQQING